MIIKNDKRLEDLSLIRKILKGLKPSKEIKEYNIEQYCRLWMDEDEKKYFIELTFHLKGEESKGYRSGLFISYDFMDDTAVDIKEFLQKSYNIHQVDVICEFNGSTILNGVELKSCVKPVAKYDESLN